MSLPFQLPNLDFNKHTCDSFAYLLNDEDLSDVTLVSDDLSQVKAHRIVLSVSSPFFRQLLQTNPQSRSVFYIGGVNQQMLKHLKDLMYIGRVEEEIENIDLFMNLVKQFRVLDHLIGEGTENQLKGEFDFKTMHNETIISNEFIFDAATVEDHNETENDDVDVTKTV